MKFLRDRFFTGLFSVLLRPEIFIISIILWCVVYWKIVELTKGADALEYGFITTIVIFGIVLFLRLRYFEELPRGVSRDTFQDRIKIGKWNVRDGFHIPKFWLVVLGVCVGIVLLSNFYDQNLIVLIIPTLVISTLVYVVMSVYARAKKQGKIKNIDTSTKLKHLPLAFVPLGIAGLVIFLIISFGQRLGVYSFFLLPLMFGFGYWGYGKIVKYQNPTQYHTLEEERRLAEHEARYGNKAIKFLGIFGGMIAVVFILIQDINSISKIGMIVGAIGFIGVLVWRRKNNGKPSILKL